MSLFTDSSHLKRCFLHWLNVHAMCVCVCLSGNWSTDGCETRIENGDFVCSCNHLSFFAVLIVSAFVTFFGFKRLNSSVYDSFACTLLSSMFLKESSNSWRIPYCPSQLHFICRLCPFNCIYSPYDCHVSVPTVSLLLNQIRMRCSVVQI